mgnify:CR=1 FL=1
MGYAGACTGQFLELLGVEMDAVGIPYVRPHPARDSM